METDATTHIQLKKLLKQVDVRAISPESAMIISKLNTLIDQTAADLKQLPSISEALATKSESETAAWTAAAESEAKMETLEKVKERKKLEVAGNRRKIGLWTRQIKRLKSKISWAKRRNAELLASVESEINQELDHGLEFLDEARRLEAEVEKISLEKQSCEARLDFLKSKYLKMKANLPF